MAELTPLDEKLAEVLERMNREASLALAAEEAQEA